MSLNNLGAKFCTEQLDIPLTQVISVLQLAVVEDCTVPFIARYRKEQIGGIDEVKIRAIIDTYQEYLDTEKRRAFVLEALKKQEQLTPELEKKILACERLQQIEDIYAPFKSKRKTKGMIAKEAGLTNLAKIILTTDQDLKAVLTVAGAKFLNPEKKITNAKEAFDGACSIIIEMMAQDADIKEKLRTYYWRDAKFTSSMKKKAHEEKDFEKFKDYFEYEATVASLKDPKSSHRFLAMRRGVTLKILKADVDYDSEKAVNVITSKYVQNRSGVKDVLGDCANKAMSNYIHPSLDLEIKAELKKIADNSAIEVFGSNLNDLLLQPYLGAKCVLGADPGVRTGVKIAVVDDSGKFLFDTVIYPHPPRNAHTESANVIDAIIQKFNIKNIAIGNGTFGRETLAFFEKHLMAIKSGHTKATLVNEDGASIYSASEIARKEFPDKDPTVRGAISIARRFQDPLAELVKIDPKSIGVGQYQHDVNQSKLKKSLTEVVETCVNFVGVDLNTASAPLLSFISGVGPSVAENIVKYRDTNGHFKSRKGLLKVKRLSAKVYEKFAGFMRIYNGENLLDGTFVHPEQYEHIQSWLSKKNETVKSLFEDDSLMGALTSDSSLRESIGNLTFDDIIKSIKAPSQDPRTEFQSTEFRKDVREFSDLKEGEWYPGVVNNITKFGAFVDIGVKESGLLHISQMADHFVEDPLKEFKVGQPVKVRITELDSTRKRIGLSCKKDGSNSDHVPSSSNSNGKRKSKDIPAAKLKNNAFAGLKDFMKK